MARCRDLLDSWAVANNSAKQMGGEKNHHQEGLMTGKFGKGCVGELLSVALVMY